MNFETSTTSEEQLDAQSSGIQSQTIIFCSSVNVLRHQLFSQRQNIEKSSAAVVQCILRFILPLSTSQRKGRTSLRVGHNSFLVTFICFHCDCFDSIVFNAAFLLDSSSNCWLHFRVRFSVRFRFSFLFPSRYRLSLKFPCVARKKCTFKFQLQVASHRVCLCV